MDLSGLVRAQSTQDIDKVVSLSRDGLDLSSLLAYTLEEEDEEEKDVKDAFGTMAEATYETLQNVDIRSFDDLVRSYPGILNTGDQQNGPQDMGWMMRSLCNTVAQLPRCVFNAERYNSALTQDEVVHALIMNKIKLPVLTSDLEDVLLAESGKWAFAGSVHDFPPCIRGSSCVGMTMDIPGRTEGFVLCAVMYEDELNDFMANKTSRRVRRPCVLCCRMAVQNMLLMLRGRNRQISVTESTVYQFYSNLVDTEGGYRSDFTTFPRSTVWEGLLCPVAQLRLSVLRAYREKGRWFVDQTPMKFVHADTPSLKVINTDRTGNRLSLTNDPTAGGNCCIEVEDVESE